MESLTDARRCARALVVAGGLAMAGWPTASAQAVPPSIAGVGLGASAATVSRQLGQPNARESTLGMRFWKYETLGITLVWKEDVAGVYGIVVHKPEAGSFGGVSIGDLETALAPRWGAPGRLRQNGRFADFIGNGWVLSVEVRDGRVIEMTLLSAVAN